jgi:hypothetical protein
MAAFFFQLPQGSVTYASKFTAVMLVGYFLIPFRCYEIKNLGRLERKYAANIRERHTVNRAQK